MDCQSPLPDLYSPPGREGGGVGGNICYLEHS